MFNIDDPDSIYTYAKKLVKLMTPYGYECNLSDDYQPAILLDTNSSGVILNMPLCKANLIKWFGDAFIHHAIGTDKIRKCFVALIGHELAHWTSGEPTYVRIEHGTGKVSGLSVEEARALSDEDRKKWLLSVNHVYIHRRITNLVCDVNDLNVVPSTWKWIQPYTSYNLSIMAWLLPSVSKRVTGQLAPVEHAAISAYDTPLIETEYDIYRLYRLTLSYMRTLRVRYENRYVRNIDKDDTIYNPLQETIKLMRWLRKDSTTIDDRITIIGKLHDIYLKIWTDAGYPQSNWPFVFKNSDPHKIMYPDNITMDPDEEPDPPGDYIFTNDDPVLAMDMNNDTSTPGYTDPNSTDVIRVTGIPTIDTAISSKVGKTLLSKLAIQHEANKLNRVPSRKGKRINSRRLYEIVIEENTPRIWKSPLAPAMDDPNGHIALILDNSSSMMGEPAKVSREIACTIVHSLWCIEKIDITCVKFGSPATVIFETKEGLLSDNMDNLWMKLQEGGNTDAPNALYKALNVLIPSHAQKKLIILTNDGDYNSSRNSITAELDRAEVAGIPVVFFGINSLSGNHIHHSWHKSIVITDIHDLPDKIKEVTETIL